MNDTAKLPIAESGIRWLWISVAVIIADQLSKFWIESHMVLGENFSVLPVFNVVRAHNPGAAFSMLAGENGWQRWFFSTLAVGVSIALLYWLRKLTLATHALLSGGLALILGGAIGNVIDRFEHGYVVDFVQVHWGAAYFPAFNVADSAISIGAALVVLDALREGGRERRAARTRKQPQ